MGRDDETRGMTDAELAEHWRIKRPAELLDRFTPDEIADALRELGWTVEPPQS